VVMFMHIKLLNSTYFLSANTFFAFEFEQCIRCDVIRQPRSICIRDVFFAAHAT